MDQTERRRPAIAVCGPGAVDDEDLARAAEALGRGLAQAGVVLVCGGLGGVMECAARGARQARCSGAQGLVVGIVPGDDAEAANPYCDLVLPSGMGLGRNVLVVRAADVVIAIGGQSGTLSELALAWQLGKPIVALDSHGGWAERLAGQAIDRRRPDRIHRAHNPDEAVEIALGLLR